MPDAANYGLLSILPPLVAIALAIWTRQVLISLVAGIFIGTTVLAGWNPFVGLVSLVSDVAVAQVGDPDNGAVLILLVCIGGYVGLLQKSGSVQAFARDAARHVNNRLKAHLAVWFGGIVIFFSDTANPLVLGPVFTPIFDRLKISREKLSYLIDSTASPVSVLVPITSWGAYIAGLIGDEYESLGIDQNPLAALLSAFPYQLYPLASLVLCGAVGLLALNFGPMREAEERAATTGQVLRPGATPMRGEDGDAPEGDPDARAATMIWSMVVLMVTVFAMFIGTGIVALLNSEEAAHIALVAPLKAAQGLVAQIGEVIALIGPAFSNGDGVRAVTTGFVLAGLTVAITMLARKREDASEVVSEWLKGGRSVFLVLLILIMAWGLGSVCDSLGTAGFIVGITEGNMPSFLIPAIIFIVGAGISFSTGTSWGSYAILMPISIPLAAQLDLSLPLMIGAVLSGGLFGDHCSPISDTTILSSIGAAADHMDHVRTQLPYALIAATAATVGFLVGAAISGPIGIAACFASLAALALGLKALGSGRQGPLTKAT